MPANLTPDYLEAEQRFKNAKSTEEKVEALEEMYSTIPKHKGTEKMQAEIKRRLSKLRTSQAKKPARRIDAMHRVDKEGAGQVALAGPPNGGAPATALSRHAGSGRIPVHYAPPHPRDAAIRGYSDSAC